MASIPRVQFLWFQGCPSHEPARQLLREILESKGLAMADVKDLDATDPALAKAERFPGSPTIRVNGSDIEPGFVDPGDYTPRCRIYWNACGASGIPEREWIEAAIDAAVSR